jgi:hypothetical protein
MVESDSRHQATSGLVRLNVFAACGKFFRWSMMTGAPFDKRLSHHADLEGHEDRIMERAANLKKRVFFLLAPFGMLRACFMRFVVNILTSFRCDVAALRFLPFLDPLIQGLQNPGVYRRDDIHRRIQLLFGHPRFPCVRKAPLHSRVAQAHHRHGEADEHFLPVGETFHRVGVTIERTKVGFLQCLSPLV